eukprot:scaffold5803_cov40-Attheya_sp.AAC.2
MMTTNKAKALQVMVSHVLDRCSFSRVVIPNATSALESFMLDWVLNLFALDGRRFEIFAFVAIFFQDEMQRWDGTPFIQHDVNAPFFFFFLHGCYTKFGMLYEIFRRHSCQYGLFQGGHVNFLFGHRLEEGIISIHVCAIKAQHQNGAWFVTTCFVRRMRMIRVIVVVVIDNKVDNKVDNKGVFLKDAEGIGASGETENGVHGRTLTRSVFEESGFKGREFPSENEGWCWAS